MVVMATEGGMNMAFWCNGKKGFCYDITKCNECEHYDGSGGEERKENKKHIIKAVRAVKPKEATP